MKTAIISDLHLGAETGADICSRREVLDVLLRGVDGSDVLVLLGDVLELRELPLSRVLERAEPFLEAVSRVAGRIVVCPGNHDWQLDPWLEQRRLREDGEAEPLGFECRFEPDPAGPLGRLRRSLDGTAIELAYPGLWVREDVYATHGHHLDCHTRTPTFEALAARGTQRVLGLSTGARTLDDHEAALAPIYQLAFSLAQGGSVRRTSRASAELWERIAGSRVRAALVGGVGLPSVLWGLRRAGLGQFSADLRPGQLAENGLSALAEWVARTGLDAEWVVFGHIHRAGPLPSDPPGWGVRGQTKLLNTGCWIYERGPFGSPSPSSPFFPGTVVRIGEEGPPVVERLLDGIAGRVVTAR